jgi:hypothetical protein
MHKITSHNNYMSRDETGAKSRRESRGVVGKTGQDNASMGYKSAMSGGSDSSDGNSTPHSIDAIANRINPSYV